MDSTIPFGSGVTYYDVNGKVINDGVNIFPPRVMTCNKLIATEPFEKQTVQSEMRGGIALATQKTKMAAMKVVLSTDDGKYNPGDTIYIRADHYAQDWAKQVHEVDGKKFILVPDKDVWVVVRG